MVRIGLISDTHGYLDERILYHLKSCDEVWHAGDIGSREIIDLLSADRTFRGVFGNIDNNEIRNLLPEHNYFRCEDKKVLITHIGGKPPKYNSEVKSKIRELRPDIFICGHSHIAGITSDPKNNLLFINPGAAGNQGFHRIRTMVRFTIDGISLREIQVIELGKRGKLA